MKYLLDTRVFLWALATPEKLNRRERALLSDERDGLFFSAASSWEISVKWGLGKLALPEAPAKYIPTWTSNWGIREPLTAILDGRPTARSSELNSLPMPPHIDLLLTVAAMGDAIRRKGRKIVGSFGRINPSPDNGCRFYRQSSAAPPLFIRVARRKALKYFPHALSRFLMFLSASGSQIRWD